MNPEEPDSDPPASSVTATFSIERHGRVELSERRPPEETQKDGYQAYTPPTPLASSDSHPVDLRINPAEDGDSYELGVSTYHVEDAATGRAFHFNIDVPLNRAQLEALHGFVGFLLRLQPLEGK